MSLAGQNAVISGAGSGIGLAPARAAAEAGAQVVLMSRKRESPEMEGDKPPPIQANQEGMRQ